MAVFRARGEEPVALGDSDVDYHVLVTVEGSLEDHRIFAPDFDDSVVSTRYYKFVFEVKLDVVHSHSCSFVDVSVAKDSLHSFELLPVIVLDVVLD